MNTKQQLFTKFFDQRAVESSGDSLWNAELDEVVVAVVELGASLFLGNPDLHLL